MKESIVRKKLFAVTTAVTILFSLLPAAIFYLGINSGTESSGTYFYSKFIAYVGAGTLCITLLLSSRYRFIDSFFIGLDKAYVIHHLFGIFAYVCMMIHFFISFVLPTMFSIEVGNRSLPHLLSGGSAFLLVTLLIFVTLFIRIPYSKWLFSHRLMGIVAILSYLHIIVLGYGNPVSIHKIIISIYFFIAISCYFYKSLFYKYLGPRVRGTISNVVKWGEIFEIYVVTKSELHILPGQYFYLSFDSPNISSEHHPFSVSACDNNNLRFSIKMKGDFVSSLGSVSIGSKIDLYGPYGGFSHYYLSMDKDAIWVAGGIGITPFLSMLQYELRNNRSRNISLFWSVSNKEDAIYLDEVLEITKDMNNFNFVLWISGESGHLSLNDIINIENDICEKLVMICAPRDMVYSLSSAMMDMGVSHKNIIYEFFNYKD